MWKSVKPTGNLTGYINTCKIQIILSSYQLSKVVIILKYNTTNLLNCRQILINKISIRDI